MSGFFSKKVKKIEAAKGSIPDRVNRAFFRRNICYVLLTCGEPNQNGEMDVEMTYEGDPYLVSYMIENAREMIERKL